MARPDNALVEALRAALRAQADPAKAPGMQAYMKSTMPYLGVTSAPRGQAQRTVFAAHPLADLETWRDTVLAIWEGAEYREERYAAIDLTGVREYRPHQTFTAMQLYERLVTEGAWWDYVDAVAIHRVGPILRSDPARMKPLMLEWSRSSDLWKRRTAIISQITFKRDLDPALLYACIEPSLDAPGFFLRKAIGWALRQHARTDPGEVARYVREHESRLSGLSRREAMKHIVPAPKRRPGG